MSLALALAVYGAAVLVVGVVSARKASRSTDAFLVADRGLGAFRAGVALSSTVIGGSTTLVLAALVASKGLPALWLDLAGALGLLALGAFLAPRVRATGATTIAEVIGRSYGPGVRRIAASARRRRRDRLVRAPDGGDADRRSSRRRRGIRRRVLVLTAALFVAYTALGGQRAVVGTDLLQFALMVGGLLLVALPLALAALARTPPPGDGS